MPRLFWGLLGISLLFRCFFFGTITVYEDDWNRYLWDGYMVSQGLSPFEHSPNQILTTPDNETFAELRKFSDDNDRFLHKINNPDLSTIYPPAAQGVFGLAAFIKPLSLDTLRLVFLFSEALALFLLVKTLPKYNRPREWALLYAFCPLLIYSGFNAVHMDILLPPFLIGTLLAIRSYPRIAGICLAGAAAVKMWPLILAPALFRIWKSKPFIYISSAILITLLAALAFWPMINALGETSGLQAYASRWHRSSLIFPYLEHGVAFFTEDPRRPARILVAIMITGLALYVGFKPGAAEHTKIPAHLMLVSLALLFLSPTGFPWYAIWVLPFIPFVPLYGVALLCALIPLHYTRFAFGEAGNYDIYLTWLVPLQFGLPLMILAIEFFVRKRTS